MADLLLSIESVYSAQYIANFDSMDHLLNLQRNNDSQLIL